MTLLLIIAIIGLVIGIGVGIDVKRNSIRYRNVYSLTKAEYTELSWPAVEIMKAWTALPVNNRPQGDMVNILRALDTKNGGEEAVSSHFEARYGHYTWSWDHRCSNGLHSKCREYVELHNGLEEIAGALAKQEKELTMAGLAFQLESAVSLVDQMRDEVRMIESVTKDMT